MHTNKKDIGLDNHAGEIYWKVIHENKIDRTSVLLYVNSQEGYYAREFEIDTQYNKAKPKALKDDLESEKHYLLDRKQDENKRMKKLQDLYDKHDFHPVHPDPLNMQTKIHVRIYKNADAPKNLFYNQYFFPGKDHRIRLVVDSELDDAELQNLFMDWEEPQNVK